MGLGSVDLVSLEEARDLARQYRRIARSGGDPLLDRQALRGQLISFREAAVQGMAAVLLKFQDQRSIFGKITAHAQWIIYFFLEIGSLKFAG